ncbi:MAG: ROK family protein [Dehalococcoidia bacterium]
MLGEDLRPTEATEGRETVIERMLDSLRKAVRSANVTIEDLNGLGVAAPGPVDWQTGHVLEPPNLPGWGDVPLGSILSEQLGLPVVLENDANAAALGEYVSGAGRGAKALIYITISTGIGGGLVFDGRLYRGVSGAAGEVGHMIIRPEGPLCGCGRHGCLEALSSGSAIGREGATALANGRAPLLRRQIDDSGQPVSALLVARAAGEGDEDAQQILHEAGVSLGIGLGNLVNLLNPDRIVIGGGAAHIGAPLLEPAEAVMRRNAFPGAAARVSLRSAELEYAAIHGVASLVADSDFRVQG